MNIGCNGWSKLLVKCKYLLPLRIHGVVLHAVNPAVICTGVLYLSKKQKLELGCKHCRQEESLEWVLERVSRPCFFTLIIVIRLPLSWRRKIGAEEKGENTYHHEDFSNKPYFVSCQKIRKGTLTHTPKSP